MSKPPIKRSEHIVTLSREHHFSLLFAWKVKRGLALGIDQERIMDYVFHFWNEHTVMHFKQEEEVLFAIHNDELVDRALKEHQEVYKIIEGFENWNRTDDISKELTALSELITAHVRFEERDLFPHLEQILTPEQLKKIEHELLDMQPEPLQDDYEDEFWDTKK